MFNIAYITSSRADYGIVRKFLRMLNEDERVNLDIIVTGAILDKAYGESYHIIEEDGFHIAKKINLMLGPTDNENIIDSMSIALKEFGKFFANNKYDLVIILGDRYEMLGVATAAAMNKLKILHLHGGEVTLGNYDEFIRHSITKMSWFHFTSTDAYRKRVIQLGEAPDKIKELPALSGTLVTLNVANNELVALPALSGTLEVLDASNNNLPGLPDLPGTLVNLNVSNNELPGLPALPGALVSLDVSDNNLPGLPDLPASLENLDVSDNELPGLPDLPAGLVDLDVSNNELSGLPALPETLESLNIKGNSDITVIVSEALPKSLVIFENDLVQNADGDFTVNGEIVRYTITVGNIENGTVKINQKEVATGEKIVVLAGEKVEVSVVPSEGYKFKEITGASGLVAVAENTYEFTMPSKDVDLAVVFEKIAEQPAEDSNTTPDNNNSSQEVPAAEQPAEAATGEKDESPKMGTIDIVLYASAIIAVISIAGIVVVKKYTK